MPYRESIEHLSKGGVVFKKPKPGEWPHYEIAGDQLSHGGKPWKWQNMG